MSIIETIKQNINTVFSEKDDKNCFDSIEEAIEVIKNGDVLEIVGFFGGG